MNRLVSPRPPILPELHGKSAVLTPPPTAVLESSMFIRYLLISMYLDHTSDFVKVHTSTSGNKVESNEVDGTVWLMKDVCDKFVSINDLWSVVSFVTNHLEVNDTSACLNIEQEWLNQGS